MRSVRFAAAILAFFVGLGAAIFVDTMFDSKVTEAEPRCGAPGSPPPPCKKKTDTPTATGTATGTPTATNSPTTTPTNTPTHTPTATETPFVGYDLSVVVPAASAVVAGGPFQAQLFVEHAFTLPDACELLPDPRPQGCYAGVQWALDYDETIVSAGPDCGGAACTGITRAQGAPNVCNLKNLNTARVLTACLDLDGDDLSYSGHAFNVAFECIAEGTAEFTLIAVGDISSVVIRIDQTQEPVRVFHDTIECVIGPTATPTATHTPSFAGFDLSARIAPDTDDVGGSPFDAQLWITHEFILPDACENLPDPKPQGCYAGVQWVLDYDETIVSAGPDCGGGTCTQITRAPGAPTACFAENVNTARVLAGCIDLNGDNLSFSGHAFNVTFNCIAEGTAAFSLTTVGTVSPLVIRSDATEEPIRVFHDTIECGGSG